MLYPPCPRPTFLGARLISGFHVNPCFEAGFRAGTPIRDNCYHRYQVRPDFKTVQPIRTQQDPYPSCPHITRG